MMNFIRLLNETIGEERAADGDRADEEDNDYYNIQLNCDKREELTTTMAKEKMEQFYYCTGS